MKVSSWRRPTAGALAVSVVICALAVGWFAGSGRVPRAALAAEGERLARFLGRELELDVGKS